MTPGSARAADECGTAASGVVDCPASDVGYPDGIHYVIDPVDPQDLTINLGDGVVIDTSGTDNSGIHAANLNGALTISGEGTTITTSGIGASGISGHTYVGDLTIHAGDIATSGDQSTGIVGSSSNGNVEITAGTIGTTGDLSYGISVLSDGIDSHVSVNAQTIETAGNSSKGIEVTSSYGSVAISAGSVTTHGSDSTGIQAVGGGDLHVAAGQVQTSGTGANGVVVLGAGDIDLNLGTVITSGDYSTGVVAHGDGNLAANIGGVITYGLFSRGIDVNVGGDAKLVVGEVSTYNHFATGIEVRAHNADVTVNGGIYTTGDYSSGVRALAYGGTAAIHNVGDVKTLGVAATGIYARGPGGVTIDGGGNVSTDNLFSAGVVGVSGGGGAVTVSQGTVTTGGDRSTGIYAGNRDFYYTGNMGDIAIHADNVATHGSASRAIMAVNYVGGNIDISVTGDVSTRKEDSTAIFAYANNGAVKVDVGGNVSTRGPDSHGLVAIGDSTDIHVGGTVSTSGDDSNAIYAFGAAGNVAIDAAGVATSGDDASGIVAVANGNVSIGAGSVSTAGNNATGIYANAGSSADGAPGNIAIDFGTLVTQGQQSLGVYAIADGGVTVHGGSISTSGTGATAVLAASLAGAADVSVGTVKTSDASGIAAFGSTGAHVTLGDLDVAGNGAYGVLASSHDGDAVITATGDVATHGFGSYALIASSLNGTAIVNAANVKTEGDDSIAILAYGAGAQVTVSGDVSVSGATAFPTQIGAVAAFGSSGNASIDAAGMIETTGYGMSAAFAHAYDAASVKVAGVKTHGDYAAGIVAIGGGNVSVEAGSIETEGKNSAGIVAIGGNPYLAGEVRVKAANVITHGYGATAISAISASGPTTVEAGRVGTDGDYAMGIVASGYGGAVTVSAGEVATAGYKAIGIYAGSGEGGALQIDAGKVATAGDFAAGIRTQTVGGATMINVDEVTTGGLFSQGLFVTTTGNGTMINAGSVKTGGQYSEGIRVNSLNGNVDIAANEIRTSGDKSAGVHVFAVGNSGKSATIDVDNIVTTGALAHGIWLENPDDGVIGYNGSAVSVASAPSRDFSITSGSIKVSGAGAIGINAIGTGAIHADVGSVAAADAQAIILVARDGADLTISGTVSSGNNNAVEVAGSDAIVDVASGAAVFGKIGLLVNAVGPYLGGGVGLPGGGTGPFAAVPGIAHIDNHGTIAGSDFALQVNSGQAIITNSGTLKGAVRTLFYDDSLTNSGTWLFGTGSDFGDGNDLLTNSGTVHLMTGAAAKVSFLGLEKFDNAGGLIDLRNDHVGDVFTLTGDYVGSGDASLAIDVDGTSADNLVINGAATGKTKLILANIGAGNATLTGSKPIVVIKTGAGSTAGAFELGASNIGFIQYGLAYEAASGEYSLVSSAGEAVYRTLKIGEGAQSIWHKSADAWASHIAELRDAGSDGTENRLWGQLYGQTSKRDDDRTIAGADYDLGYRQKFHGAQLGYDFGGGDAFSWGVTGGYIGSKLDYAGTGEKIKYDDVNVGAYAGYKSGVFFANALIKYDHSSIKATSAPLDYSDRFKGSSVGARLDAGARLGSDRFFIEPAASISWLSTNLDDLKALGQTIDFDTAKGLRGKLGGRIGGTSKMAGGSTLTYYAGGSVVHEFEGEDGVTLESGGATDHVANRRIGTYGQAVIGLNLQSIGRVSGFVEANGETGGGYKGAGGRAGIRIKL